MVTEKKTEPAAEVHPLFDNWLEKQMRELKPELVNPPAGAVDVAGGRERFRQESADRWNQLLERGYTERELAGVDDDPGSFMGRAKRPPLEGTLDDATIARARQVRDALRARGMDLGAIEMDTIERSARGAWSSAAVTAENTISQAESAIRGRDAAKASAARSEADKARISVVARCGPTLCYTGTVGQPQEYVLTEKELTALQEWATRIEAQARQGRTLASLGFHTWPAYVVLVEPQPAPVTEGAIGGSLLSP